MPSAPLARYGNDRGNVDVTLQNGEAEIVVFNTPITANRTITLPRSPDNNDRFYVNRKAGCTGAFNLNINTPAAALLKALGTAGTWALVVYNDGQGWQLVAAGTL
jgi:hypothetical protein